MEKLKIPAYDPDTIEHDFEYIASKLEIPITELRSYLDAPNKSYRDYKNQQMVYDIGAKAMRILGLELGGKR